MELYFVSSIYDGFFVRRYGNNIFGVESFDEETFTRIVDAIFDGIKKDHPFASKKNLMIVSINKL